MSTRQATKYFDMKQITSYCKFKFFTKQENIWYIIIAWDVETVIVWGYFLTKS